MMKLNHTVVFNKLTIVTKLQVEKDILCTVDYKLNHFNSNFLFSS